MGPSLLVKEPKVRTLKYVFLSPLRSGERKLSNLIGD